MRLLALQFCLLCLYSRRAPPSARRLSSTLHFLPGSSRHPLIQLDPPSSFIRRGQAALVPSTSDPSSTSAWRERRLSRWLSCRLLMGLVHHCQAHQHCSRSCLASKWHPLYNRPRSQSSKPFLSRSSRTVRESYGRLTPAGWVPQHPIAIPEPAPRIAKLDPWCWLASVSWHGVVACRSAPEWYCSISRTRQHTADRATDLWRQRIAYRYLDHPSGYGARRSRRWWGADAQTLAALTCRGDDADHSILRGGVV